jgi:hypothetical protein
MRDAQADVPSARSFGRNLRSKTRWFTGFCNSHQVSHFATFFIDARAEISVAESRLLLRHDTIPMRRVTGQGEGAHIWFMFLDAFAPGVVIMPRARPSRGGAQGRQRDELAHRALATPLLPREITCSLVVLLGRLRQ